MPGRSRDTEPNRNNNNRERDSYRPQPQRGERGGNRGGRGGGAPFKRKPFVPLPAHDRPILSFDYREKTPELMPGMVTAGFELANNGEEEEEEEKEENGGEQGDEEVPMEHSDDDEPAASGSIAPEETVPSTAPETEEGKASTVVIPTVNGAEKKLEVVEGKDFVEADKKRIDVITMIRQAKAKAAAEKEIKKDSVAANDDFISLNFDDDKPKKSESESDEEREYDNYRKRRRLNDRAKASTDLPEDVPRPFSHRESLHGPYIPKDPENDGPPGVAPGVGPLSRAGKLPPPPGPSQEVRKALGRRKGHEDSPSDYDSYDDYDDEDYDPESLGMAGAAGAADFDFDGPDIPRTRKRKHDQISMGNHKVDGNITREWRVKPGVESAPWTKEAVDHSRSLKMSTWYVYSRPFPNRVLWVYHRLHIEIIDFVEYIKPRPYEHAVRRFVIQRVRDVARRLFHDTDVRVFGSFAAELYLPTSDVDLVIISRDFARTETPKYDAKKRLWGFKAALQNARIAAPNSIQVIANAKVPLVKFKDAITGFSVDVSFENKTGLVANGTFNSWRERYPCLPLLLTLVKQFLAMRGLNEVYIGGVGSFTLTCLLVSLFQQLPSVASGDINPSDNLGIMLLEFLELYGKRFNTRRVGIRVDDIAPGYFRRDELYPMPPRPKPQDEFLLAIQDPNVPSNNISRSSYMIELVLECFGDAYDVLTAQMAAMDVMDFERRKGRSLLGRIIGGDYTHLEHAREKLRHVYLDYIGTEADLRELGPGQEIDLAPPPLPPGPPPRSPPPPPPPPAKNGSGISRGRDRNRGGANAGRGRGGGAPMRGTKRPAIEIEDDDAFERMRTNNGPGRRNGRGRGGKNDGSGGRNDPITLD
jgi:non-canonical poly(A) RNA polymerase PAPD5/7